MIALRRFHGGVHPKEYKELSRHCAIEGIPLPERLHVPFHQHIGAPCDPCVAPGEKVLKGQVIGRAGGFVSAPVHAPTSGTIEAIVEHVAGHPSGLTMLCAVLVPDGNDQWHPDLKGLVDPLDLEPQEIRDKIRDAGIVGLGGATFPSHVKLTPSKTRPVEVLLINGAECEPYLTCDARLMEERFAEITDGIRYMLHALQTTHCVVCIEENKPGAIQAMTKAANETRNIQVLPLPVMYPQGAEKQLIEVVTGRQVPVGGLPGDIGVIVHNVATALAVREAIRHGRPLTHRVVTVTGQGIAHPANLEVPIGTPIQTLIDHCGGLKSGVKKVIMGGPMMGVALNDLRVPVVKGTSGILALLTNETVHKPEQPCIRCGNCVRVCPLNLTPCEMAWRAKHDLVDQLDDVHLRDCCECGTCAYACPSNIPLVHYFRYGKFALAAKKREKDKTTLTKSRTAAKEARVAAEKAEKERKKEEMRLAMEAKRKAAAAAAPTPAPAGDDQATPTPEGDAPAARPAGSVTPRVAREKNTP
ncbi:MAG: electron transport complex subunit RsxC [Magnetococcales bacterium]|nr:electron transport complex subunit RsxC [Magnetococcales bacterium]